MTIVAKCLIETQVAPIAETSLYPAPANTRTIIDKLSATNTTAGALTITIKLVPAGQVAGVAYEVSHAASIAAGQSYTFPEVIGHVLASGDFISVIASAAGINIRASGREVS